MLSSDARALLLSESFVLLFPRPLSERIVSFAHSFLISQLTSLLLRRFAQLSRSRYLLLLGLWSMLTADILIWMLTSFLASPDTVRDNLHKILTTIRGALGVVFDAKLLYSRRLSV